MSSHSVPVTTGLVLGFCAKNSRTIWWFMVCRQKDRRYTARKPMKWSNLRRLITAASGLEKMIVVLSVKMTIWSLLHRMKSFTCGHRWKKIFDSRWSTANWFFVFMDFQASPILSGTVHTAELLLVLPIWGISSSCGLQIQMFPVEASELLSMFYTSAIYFLIYFIPLI